MLRKSFALTVGALVIASSGAWAQNVGEGLLPGAGESASRVGTRGANWLEFPVGARAQALGWAGTALISGAQALAWNVAAIAEVESFDIAWSYSELFDEADITHQFGGVVLPISASGALGVSVISLSSGDIIRTTERFPEGGDPVFGETFTYSGFAGSLGYGHMLTDRLSVGAAVKLVSEGIDDAKADWVSFDVGARFRTGLFAMTLGAAVVNIAGDSRFEGSAIEQMVGAGEEVFPTGDNVPIRYDTRELALPTAFRFSVLFDVTGTAEAWLAQVGLQHRIRLVADLYDSIDTAPQPSFGVEYAYREIAFARIGKRFLNEDKDESFRDFSDGFAFGGGINVPLFNRHLGFDYAYTSMGILENIQTFTFRLGP